MLARSIILLLLFAIFYSTALFNSYAATIPSAYQLTTLHVEDAVEKTLEARGVAQNVSVEMIGARGTVLYESKGPVTPQLSGLVYDERSSRWNANLVILSGDKVEKAIPVGGRFFEVTELPVVKRQIRKGAVIQEQDIETMEVRTSRVHAGTARSADQLVGLSPRRSISPQRPIRLSEVSEPAILKKNSLVRMVYRSGNLEIVTTGQAMADGAPGELIEVRNMASRNMVQAVVDDEKTVIVEPLSNSAQLDTEEGLYAQSY